MRKYENLSNFFIFRPCFPRGAWYSIGKPGGGGMKNLRTYAIVDHLKEKKYFPIDTDQVGLILESKKAKFWEEKNKN